MGLKTPGVEIMDQPLPIRSATRADLDALVRVYLETTEQDPSTEFRFPLRKKFSHDFEARVRHKCAEYLNTLLVAVCETQDGPNSTVVGFACWAWILPTGSAYSYAHRKVANCNPPPSEAFAIPARAKAFQEKCSRAKKRMFDSQYPNGYMLLKVVYCHPSYQRRGVGSALAMWGIRMAYLEELPTAVLASLAGQRLYESLGFRVVDRFKVHVDNNNENNEQDGNGAADGACIDITGMVLDHAKPYDLELRLYIAAALILVDGLQTVEGISLVMGSIDRMYSERYALDA